MAALTINTTQREPARHSSSFVSSPFMHPRGRAPYFPCPRPCSTFCCVVTVSPNAPAHMCSSSYRPQVRAFLATKSKHRINLVHAVGLAFTLAFTPTDTATPSRAAGDLCFPPRRRAGRSLVSRLDARVCTRLSHRQASPILDHDHLFIRRCPRRVVRRLC
jgi:hypothetical protein